MLKPLVQVVHLLDSLAAGDFTVQIEAHGGDELGRLATSAGRLRDDLGELIRDIAGLDPPPDSAVDGLSLTPVLDGSGGLNRDTLYWHYPHYHHMGYQPASAVRMADYKLIEWHEATIPPSWVTAMQVTNSRSARHRRWNFG